jgi:hypothetical protein
MNDMPKILVAYATNDGTPAQAARAASKDGEASLRAALWPDTSAQMHDASASLNYLTY